MGSIVKGIFGGASAAKGAAAAQVAGQEKGIAEQRRQFDITQEQFAPFREAALPALEQQQALLGLTGPESQQAAFQALQETPGQRFIRERAQKSLLRGASAIGGLGGGNIRTALVEQGAGFAQQDLANQFNRLGALTGGGQAATQAVGQFGQQTSGNIANLLAAQGQSRASGILGAQQARAGLAGNVLSLAGFGLGGGFGSFGGAGGAGAGFTASPFVPSAIAPTALGGFGQFRGLA